MRRLYKVWQIASEFSKKLLLLFYFIVFLQAGAAMVAMYSVLFLSRSIFSEDGVISVMGHELSVFNAVLCFICAQLFAFFVGCLSEGGRGYWYANFSRWLKVNLLRKVLRREYSFFVNSDMATVQQTVHVLTSHFCHLLNQYMDLSIKVISALAFLVVAILMNPIMCIVFAAVIIAYYLLVIKVFSKFRRKVNSKLDVSQRALASLSTQMLNGVKMLRVSQKEEYYLTCYEEQASDLAKYGIMPIILSVYPKLIVELLLFIMVGSMTLYHYITDTLVENIPSMAVLLFVAFKVLPLMQGSYALYNMVITNNYIADRVHEQYYYEGKVAESTCSVDVLEFNHTITTAGLMLSYDNGDAIKFPDLEIKYGDKVGIKGPSGSGKSTLLDIILGFYVPDNGSVLVDGKVVNDAELRTLHRDIGYVSQDTFLLNASITENITLMNPSDADQEKLIKAAQSAQIYDHVMGLEDGFDTLIGDRGMKLSGGQRQRISIARALYSDPKILLLDEATSALDDQTEVRIMDTIYSLDKDITIVMVAHRLSTLERADKVIELG